MIFFSFADSSASDSGNLLSAAAQLKSFSSKTVCAAYDFLIVPLKNGETPVIRYLILNVQVAEALGKVGEHKRALEEAEKMEKELMSLVTGQKSPGGEPPSLPNNRVTTTPFTREPQFTVVSFYFFLIDKKAIICFEKCYGILIIITMHAFPNL